MVYRAAAVIIAIFGLTTLFVASSVAAAPLKGEGLVVSPLRQEVDIAAGSSKSGHITVANNTDDSLTVRLSVKEFLVADYTYDYTFRDTEFDWIKLSANELPLRPGENRTVPYEITVPEGMAAGGYYFSLLTSKTIEKGGSKRTLQAATLFYMTVDGDKARRNAEVINEQIPQIATGLNIPYKYDFYNTGNIHLRGYYFAKLEGMFGYSAEVGSGSITMPQKTKTFDGVLQSPLWPGVYQLTVGYKPDQNATEGIMKTVYIVFIPPWSVVALLLALMTGSWLWQRKKQRKAD